MTSTTHDQSATDPIALLGDITNGLAVAMCTTVDANGIITSRPLNVHGLDGRRFWFVVDSTADWVRHLDGGASVNLAFVDRDQRWVSVVGTAELVDERDVVERLWSDSDRSWLPGPDDPNVVALAVDATSFESWDAESATLVRLDRNET